MLTAVTNIPHSRVVIIGDGPDRQRLQNLLPNALFLGRLGGNDLSQAVASLDIMITPGEKETFCQVIQESMAAGVPVIAPAVGGPKDLVTHNHNGLLYTPGDREELNVHTSYLVRNSQVRRTMSVNARETVQDRSWNEICGQLITHYENAISLSSGALI
jgi:phosphatidylinositol alpha 1,6-mannosyltransferase